MDSVLNALPNLSYPAIYWFPGYVGIIPMPEAFCVFSKGWLAREQKILEKNKIRTLDSQGNYFKIVGYEPIPPFEGWKWRLRRTFFPLVFVKPIIEDLRQLELPEYKKKLAWAMHARFQYDLDKYKGVEIIRKLKTAKSHQEAMACVLKLWP